MASKQVKDELKLGYVLVSGGREWADEIARRRAAQLAALGLARHDTEPTVRAGLLQELAAVERRAEVLLDADDALDAAESRDPAVLARRDTAHERCLKTVVAAREVIATACDETAQRNLGFHGATPRDAESIEKLAGRVASRMAVSPPTATRRGVTLDTHALCADLRRDHAELKDANEAARTSKHAIVLARARRDEAWTLYTAERTQVGARFDATLRLVGLGDAAEGLLPSRTKTAREADAPKTETHDATPSNAQPAPPKEATTRDAQPEASATTTPAVNTRASMPAPPS